MSRNLINLLPESRIRAFRRAYFFRLATVGLALLALVIAVHTILLLPSFLYLGAEQSAREGELARLSRELDSASASSAAQELASLNERASYLARLGAAPTASGSLRALLAVPHGGISITGISYAPPSGDAGNGVLSVSGIAESRDALRTYERLLHDVPGVASVELPLGAYARVADIDFTVTLKGSFLP